MVAYEGNCEVLNFSEMFLKQQTFSLNYNVCSVVLCSFLFLFALVFNDNYGGSMDT